MRGGTTVLEAQETHSEAYAAAYARALDDVREMRDVANVFMLLVGGPLIVLFVLTRAFKRINALARAQQDG